MAIRKARGSVLVVDDDETVLKVVGRYLEGAGYGAELAADGREALRLAGQRRPDLAVVDIMLPGPSGLDVMRALRSQTPLPVILLTARGEAVDRVAGLRLGADDYVPKPFSPRELIARVDAVLRRVDRDPAREQPVVFDGLSIDQAARRVTVRGREVRLTKLEYDLLLFLACHPHRVFTRDELLESVWGAPFYYETSTVPVHVRRLRAKIEDDPSRPQLLQTVWGVGYRFQP